MMKWILLRPKGLARLEWEEFENAFLVRGLKWKDQGEPGYLLLGFADQ